MKVIPFALDEESITLTLCGLSHAIHCYLNESPNQADMVEALLRISDDLLSQCDKVGFDPKQYAKERMLEQDKERFRSEAKA